MNLVSRFYLGDYVRHNTFPPVEGYVSIIKPGKGALDIGVLQANGIVFYDEESTWEGINPLVSQERFNDSNIIDAEYEVIEDDS